jgi:predicted nucleic acid-binding protein
MPDYVLVDAGPLVAILCREDAEHQRCVEALQSIRADLVTCWPVLTEVIHLLGGRLDRVRHLLAMMINGALRCSDLPNDAAELLDRFYVRFADQRPDLADAALILLAERDFIDTVFSLDQRDFAVYRTTDGRALTLIPTLS